MISLRVRDVRGCERAEISCGPIALVAGRNGAGKSSIAQATGAALTGQTLPLGRGSGGDMVLLGASAASVELRGESGTARIDWPAAAAMTQGVPPHASQWAAGLDSIALQQPKERAQVLAEYLHADPTREDLVQALADVELDHVAAHVWKLVTDHGWDAAHALRKDKGSELKGRWREVTGRNWGSRIAASWVPDDYLLVDEGHTEDDLVALVARAKQQHDRAVGAVAVSGAERERLAAEAAQVEPRKDALAAAEIEEARLEEEHKKALTQRASLPPAGAELPMPCPHCGGSIVLRQIDLATRRLEKAETIPADELKRRRLVIAEADGALSRLNTQLHAQGHAVEVARNLLQIALEARNRLAKAPPDENAHDAEDAKAAVDEAERRLAAWRQKVLADDLRDQVKSNEALLDILAPDGLRAKKLARVLDAFNGTQLAPLCDAADWKTVTVDPAMTLAYGGRRYGLLSTSEQYRVRAVVAVAMAKLDGSDMVALDAADVLDGTTRSGLFALLDEAAIPALVAMTLTRREQVPDLAASELGCSYWIEDGIAQPLHAMREAAA
jgi:hypothetical protein